MHQHIDTLESLHCKVVLISFGNSKEESHWIVETGVPFGILLDPERVAYQANGLDRSLIRSWGPKVWYKYAQLLLSGRSWRGIQGDSAQLGGDFIVDRNGIIHLAYRSHDPTDRPSVRRVLEILNQIEIKEENI